MLLAVCFIYKAGRKPFSVVEIVPRGRTTIGIDRNPETRNIADTARERGTTSQDVSSYRTRKRGKVTNKVKILLTLLVMIVPMMLLSLLLDVLRPMMSGYLTLHEIFICVHIEIGLILLIPLLMLVPFWVLIIHHARLKA